jgi:hypothetical protein
MDLKSLIALAAAAGFLFGGICSRVPSKRLSLFVAAAGPTLVAPILYWIVYVLPASGARLEEYVGWGVLIVAFVVAAAVPTSLLGALTLRKIFPLTVKG